MGTEVMPPLDVKRLCTPRERGNRGRGETRHLELSGVRRRRQ
jgi:hypothetical protein